MTNYYFDANGYFIRQTQANSGSAAPRNATRDVPPETGDHEIARRVGQIWTVETTHMGKDAWDTTTGHKVTIERHGPLADGLTLLAPDVRFPVWDADAGEWITDLDKLKEAKAAQITGRADQLLKHLGAEYGEMERATWDQQYAEATAYQADALADVPLLTAIATARSMDVAVLAARVIANRAAWVSLSGHVVGQRLAYQDALDAAGEDAAAIEAIEVAYVLP
jgi:hypothetical protein